MMWTSPLLQVHGECNVTVGHVHLQLAETITAGPNCLTSPNLYRDNHFTKMILLYKSVNNSNNATTTYIYIYAVYQKSQIKIALYVFITFSPNTCITWCIKFPLFPDITYVYENSQYMSVNISSDSTKYRTKVLYSFIQCAMKAAPVLRHKRHHWWFFYHNPNATEFLFYSHQNSN